MPRPLENFIADVVPDPTNCTVTLTWANGDTSVSAFGHLIGKGVMRRLADPEFFARAIVGERPDREHPVAMGR